MGGATDTELRELERAHKERPDDQDTLLTLARAYFRAGRQEDCRDLKSKHVDYLAWHRGAVAIKNFLLEELAQLPYAPLTHYGGERISYDLGHRHPSEHPGLMIWQANSHPYTRRFVVLIPKLEGVTQNGLHIFDASDCIEPNSSIVSEMYPHWPGREEAGLYTKHGRDALRRIYVESWNQQHRYDYPQQENHYLESSGPKITKHFTMPKDLLP